MYTIKWGTEFPGWWMVFNQTEGLMFIPINACIGKRTYFLPSCLACRISVYKCLDAKGSGTSSDIIAAIDQVELFFSLTWIALPFSRFAVGTHKHH